MSRARSSWPWAGRAAALLVVGCSALGCSQALGLEGLTFEEPDSGEDAGSPDSAIERDADAPPDASPSIAVDINTYPGVLENRLLVANPDTSQATYLVYDAESGEVVMHEVIDDSHYEPGEAWTWKPGWSLLLQIPRGEGTMLIGYDRESGLAEHVGIDEHGVRTQGSETVAGSPGWTHFLPVEVGGIWHNVAYDTETGRYRFGPALVEEADEGEVSTGMWETGWTTLTAIPIGQEVGVLKYNAVTGAAEVEQLTGDAAGRGVTWSGEFDEALSMLLLFSTGEGLLSLTYSSELGDVATSFLSLDEGIVLEPHEFNAWRIELSQMLPIWLGSEPYAVTYSAVTGVAELRTVLPLESSPAVLK